MPTILLIVLLGPSPSPEAVKVKKNGSLLAYSNNNIEFMITNCRQE